MRGASACVRVPCSVEGESASVRVLGIGEGVCVRVPCTVEGEC